MIPSLYVSMYECVYIFQSRKKNGINAFCPVFNYVFMFNIFVGARGFARST